MNVETIITGLKTDFEIVAIPLPIGQMVECIRREAVLIPIAKVMVYGLGKSLATDEETVELEHLKGARRADQRAFMKSGKVDRLHELERKQDNQRKSLENLKAFLESGMTESLEDIRNIMSHLLELGATVTTSTAGGHMMRSQFNTLKGTLIIQTGWKVLEDSKRYMTTIHFLPSKS